MLMSLQVGRSSSCLKCKVKLFKSVAYVRHYISKFWRHCVICSTKGFALLLLHVEDGRFYSHSPVQIASKDSRTAFIVMTIF